MDSTVQSFQGPEHFCPNLGQVVEYIFCIPGTSAPVERVFSATNNVWSEERGRMAKSTVKGLM
jgi:hypothetical protein